MPVTLSERARDRGTFAVTIDFTDEEGSAITPSSVKWTLLGRANQVVNSRDAVTETPGTSVTAVLGADDLDYADGDVRHLVFDWEYNSSLGDGLAGREQVTFYIDNIQDKVVTV